MQPVRQLQTTPSPNAEGVKALETKLSDVQEKAVVLSQLVLAEGIRKGQFRPALCVLSAGLKQLPKQLEALLIQPQQPKGDFEAFMRGLM